MMTVRVLFASLFSLLVIPTSFGCGRDERDYCCKLRQEGVRKQAEADAYCSRYNCGDVVCKSINERRVRSSSSSWSWGGGGLKPTRRPSPSPSSNKFGWSWGSSPWSSGSSPTYWVINGWAEDEDSWTGDGWSGKQNPTNKPTIHPTKTPVTSSPTEGDSPFVFDGIDDAGSLYKGVISILWEWPHHVDGDIVDLESVRYHILSYAGSFDFQSVLENSNYTTEALISDFEVNSWNETTGIQYHLVNDGRAYEFELNTTTTFSGKMHSLIVIAEVDGVYSNNTDVMNVYASEVDPVFNEDVNIVGIFVPTALLAITINDDNTMIEFDGPVRQKHKDLVVGDYVYGISNSSSIETEAAPVTKNEEFLLLVTSVVESSDQRVVLRTEAPKIEDVFDEVDFGLAIGMSRPNKVNTSQASRHKHRHLIQRRQRRLGDRRLFLKFLKKVGKWLSKGAKEAVDWIGDNIVTPVAKDFEDLWNLVKNGQVKKNFKLIDFYASFTYEVAPKKNSTSTSGSGKLGIGKVDVNIVARSDIYVKMRVSLKNPQLKAEAGWRASYSADFDISLFGGSEFILEKTLKEGAKKKYKFFVGPVPVWFDVQPKIDSKFSVKTSSDNGAVKLSVGGKGRGHASVTAHLPPKMYTDFEKPTFTPYFKSDLLSQITFTVGIFVVPLVKVNLYSGAVKGELSLATGAELETLMSADAIFTGETCDVFDGLDISYSVSGDIKVGTAFDDGLKKEGNLYKESWPLLKIGETKCPDTSTCSGDDFFTNVVEDFGDTFNSEIFLSQGASPSDPPFLSTVYKFEDFVNALINLDGKSISMKSPFGGLSFDFPLRPRSKFQMWLGDKCGTRAKLQTLVNIAAFLGQAMRETIIYDACDENNLDIWYADIFKESTSPMDMDIAHFYPMSSSCGQQEQSYEDYDCEDACPKNPLMEITGSTNADWAGAPPPLFCGPKSKFDDLGYWNPMQFCQGGSAGTQGTEESCKGQPFYYDGQKAGVHIPKSEDSQYPSWYYANPIPGKDGTLQFPRFENLPRTNVEGCCWWGRGVFQTQTTGRCKFGRLNKNIGAGGGAEAVYPQIDFCSNPQSICEGPSDLKWTSGIFYWVSEVEKYSGYKGWVNDFIDAGCTVNPDLAECDTLFRYTSGVVNRGCHDPAEDGGCPEGWDRNIPERIAASKRALRALFNLPPGNDSSRPTPKPTTSTPPPTKAPVTPLPSPTVAPAVTECPVTTGDCMCGQCNEVDVGTCDFEGEAAGNKPGDICFKAVGTSSCDVGSSLLTADFSPPGDGICVETFTFGVDPRCPDGWMVSRPSSCSDEVSDDIFLSSDCAGTVLVHTSCSCGIGMCYQFGNYQITGYNLYDTQTFYQDDNCPNPAPADDTDPSCTV